MPPSSMLEFFAATRLSNGVRYVFLQIPSIFFESQSRRVTKIATDNCYRVNALLQRTLVIRDIEANFENRDKRMCCVTYAVRTVQYHNFANGCDVIIAYNMAHLCKNAVHYLTSELDFDVYEILCSYMPAQLACFGLEDHIADKFCDSLYRSVYETLRFFRHFRKNVSAGGDDGSNGDKGGDVSAVALEASSNSDVVIACDFVSFVDKDVYQRLQPETHNWLRVIQTPDKLRAHVDRVVQNPKFIEKIRTQFVVMTINDGSSPNLSINHFFNVYQQSALSVKKTKKNDVDPQSGNDNGGNAAKSEVVGYTPLRNSSNRVYNGKFFNDDLEYTSQQLRAIPLRQLHYCLHPDDLHYTLYRYVLRLDEAFFGTLLSKNLIFAVSRQRCMDSWPGYSTVAVYVHDFLHQTFIQKLRRYICAHTQMRSDELPVKKRRIPGKDTNITAPTIAGDSLEAVGSDDTHDSEEIDILLSADPPMSLGELQVDTKLTIYPADMTFRLGECPINETVIVNSWIINQSQAVPAIPVLLKKLQPSEMVYLSTCLSEESFVRLLGKKNFQFYVNRIIHYKDLYFYYVYVAVHKRMSGGLLSYMRDLREELLGAIKERLQQSLGGLSALDLLWYNRDPVCVQFTTDIQSLACYPDLHKKNFIIATYCITSDKLSPVIVTLADGTRFHVIYIRCIKLIEGASNVYSVFIPQNVIPLNHVVCVRGLEVFSDPRINFIIYTNAWCTTLRTVLNCPALVDIQSRENKLVL